MSSPGPLAEHVHQNIEGILSFHRREKEKLTPAERRLERFSAILGRPVFLAVLGVLVCAWIGTNLILGSLGHRPPDPPPFALLQGLLTLAALTTTTIVLITQRVQARFEHSRDHLDLQVNLLTEQKVTKLIHLLEELRRDLPMVENRVDPEVTALQHSADPVQVLSALEVVNETMEGKSARDTPAAPSPLSASEPPVVASGPSSSSSAAAPGGSARTISRPSR